MSQTIDRLPSRRIVLLQGALGVAGIGLHALCSGNRALALPGSPADAKTRKLMKFQQADWISHLAFTPQGARLATTSYLLKPEVYLWALDSGALVQKFRRRDQGCKDLIFSTDGRLLLVHGDVNPYHDKEAVAFQVFDFSQGQGQGQTAASFDLGRKSVSYSSCALSADAKMLAALIDRVGPHKPGVELWDVPARRLLDTLPLGEYDHFNRVVFSADGNTLRAHAERHTVSWNLSTKVASDKRFAAAPEISNSFFSRDGTRCLGHINAFTDKSYDRDKEYNKLRVYDTSDYKLLWQLDGLKTRALRCFDFSPSGTLLALSCHATPLVRAHDYEKWPDDVGYEVKVFELGTGAEIFQLPAPAVSGVTLPTRPNEKVVLSFSADSRSLALYGWDNSAYIFPIDPPRASLKR